MRSRWSLALFVVWVLTTSSVGADAWPQYRGDTDRSATLDPLPPVLDVLRTGGLHEEAVSLGGINVAPLMLRNDRAWIWLERDGPGCDIVQRTLLHDAATEQRWRVETCNSGLLQAIDPPTGNILLCGWANGDAPVLLAVEPGGEVAWSVTPNGTLGLPSTQGIGGLDFDWRCSSTALVADERVAYVAFQERCEGPSDAQVCPGIHRIAAIDLDDGSLVWRVDVQDRFAEGPISMGLPNEGSGSLPQGITVAGDHLIITMYQDCNGCDGPGAHQLSVGWLSRSDGGRIGFYDREDTDVDGTGPAATSYIADESRLAVAQSGLAALFYGESAMIIDPTIREPARFIPLENGDSGPGLSQTATGAWWNNRLFLASTNWIHAIDMDRGDEIWDWTAGPNWWIEHVAVTVDGDLIVVLIDLTGTEAIRMVRLAPGTGTVLQQLPIDLDVSFEDEGLVLDSTNWKVDLIQGANGELVLVDQQGAYAVVGNAPEDERPALTITDLYPASGIPVRLDAGPAAADDITQVQVAWGDGMRQMFAAGDVMEHRYAENGDHDIVVTFLRDDGTTRSAKTTVHVGATAPRELTPIQQVFAPENADITWGILGVAIAIFGGLMALARSRVRKNRLEYKLREIERIKLQADHDVPGAIRAIDAYREKLRDDLRRGKVDDIQYAVLESEMQGALRLWYHRLLAPYETRMSDRFRRHLTASLEDGTLHAPEATRLIEALGAETKLRRDERDALQRFLREWSRREPTAGPS